MTFKPEQSAGQKKTSTTPTVTVGSKINAQDAGHLKIDSIDPPRIQAGVASVRASAPVKFIKENAQTVTRFSFDPAVRNALGLEDAVEKEIERRVQAELVKVQEAARVKGQEEGYQAGLEKGYQASFQKFAQEASVRIESFESFMQQLENMKAELFQANERFIVEMVYGIGKKILLQELQVHPDYVKRLASEIIRSSPLRENIKIRMAPQDQITAQMVKESLEKEITDLKNLSVEVSPDIEAGGCIVETDFTSIDATVQTQLERIHQSLLAELQATTEKAS